MKISKLDHFCQDKSLVVYSLRRCGAFLKNLNMNMRKKEWLLVDGARKSLVPDLQENKNREK